jgi:hypothetical protein
MTTVNGSTLPIQVVTVAQQGLRGPRGFAGPGFTSRMGNVFIKQPEAETIPLISSSAYAFTIGGLNGLKVASGSLSLSIQINDVDVEGLADIVVTSTPQDLTATAANEVAEGDRLTLVLAGVSSASGLEFTMS